MAIQITITDINDESPEALTKLADYLYDVVDSKFANKRGDKPLTPRGWNERVDDKTEGVQQAGILGGHQTPLAPREWTKGVEIQPENLPATKEEIAEFERDRDASREPTADDARQDFNKPSSFGVQVDSQGYPWDTRIHTDARTKIADGTWKLKRGVDKDLVEKVRKEYDQLAAIPVAPVAPLIPDLVPLFPPVPPPAPTAPIAPPVPDAPAPTFQQLMLKVGALVHQKVLDKVKIDSACAQVGIPSLPMLSNRPDLIPQMIAILGVTL